jgi:hypothetical protein
VKNSRRTAAVGLRLSEGLPTAPAITEIFLRTSPEMISRASKNIFSLISQKRKSLNTTKTAGSALTQRILLYLC